MHRKMVKDVLAELIKSSFSGEFQYYPQTELPADFVYYTYNDVIQQSDFKVISLIGGGEMQSFLIVKLFSIVMKFYLSH